MMGSSKICRICRKPCSSNFSTIFQKVVDGLDEVSALKSGNLTVTPAMQAHDIYRKNYTRTLGVHSNSTEVSDR